MLAWQEHVEPIQRQMRIRADRAERRREPAPEPTAAEQAELDRRPDFDALEMRQLVALMDAWHALGGDRHIGFGVMGCIPFAAILRYADFYGLDRDATTILVDVIRILDRDRVDREESARKLKGAA